MHLPPLLLFLTLLTSTTTAQQQPYAISPPHPQSLSLVDLLSSSTNHTLLLKALQRARLIPLLNRLNGSTLWAPTDRAIEREKEREREKRGTGEDAVALWCYATRSNDEEDEGVEGRPGQDNLQLALRDTLLYHLFNYTLFPAPSPPPPTNDTPPVQNASFPFFHPSPLPLNTPILHSTLFFPRLESGTPKSPLPSLPGDDDEGGEGEGETRRGMLGEGQKVRVIRKEGKKGKKTIWIGGDWKGEGGVEVVSASVQYAANGVMLSLDGVLEKPVDLGTHIRTNPELSILASILPTAILDYISTVSHLTLFAPTNAAWGILSDLEMRYLRSGFAETDLTEIFGDGASKEGVGEGKIGYLERLVGRKETGMTIPTLLGGSLTIVPGLEGSVFVNGSRISTGDILAQNGPSFPLSLPHSILTHSPSTSGVLHTVPSLLLPSGSLALTAEKYLIALNATRFVSLLRSVNLSHYVQVPSDQSEIPESTSQLTTSTSLPSYTILAPSDDILKSHWLLSAREGEAESATRGEWKENFPEPGSEELRELLLYHIVQGKWTTEDLEDGMLVGTELRGEKLKGHRQRLLVNVQSPETSGAEAKLRGWGVGVAEKDKDKDGKGKKNCVVGFGGASVLGEPVQVGNSIIYLISSVLQPPSSIVTTAVSDLRLSTFVASVYSASLDKILSNTPAVTFLVPENNAFTSLGLVMSYLLLPIALDELSSLIRYHAINEIVYVDQFPAGSARRYPTLDGAEIYVQRSATNSTLLVHGPTIGGHAANGEQRDARMIRGDVLTATGVIHIVDQVELPPSLNIGVAKLLKGAKAGTFADLIRAANMSWVLEGKRPPTPPPSSSLLEPLSTTTTTAVKKSPASNRAYTILCPTDKALSRLNLTYYLSTPTALLSLVKLHIIPTDAFAPLSSDGHPLPLSDEITYSTLLDRKEVGGTSKYGTVAFRSWGEQGWLVGIQGARGSNGGSDSARVVNYGRTTPWFVPEEEEHPPLSEGGNGRAGTMAPPMRIAGGGGVLLIDSVLLPYQPGFFREHAVALFVSCLFVLLGVGGAAGYRVWKAKKVAYVRLEGEED